ncbi:MAG: SlyX family protein [Pirellulales bacterium]
MTDPQRTPAQPINRNSSSLESLQARLTEMESRYTHLQRLVETLNEVVIGQGKQLEIMDRNFRQLGNQLFPLLQSGAEPRSLEEDKPPHY